MLDYLFSDSSAGIFIGAGIGAIVVLAVFIAANWKIFTKAGKPGWHSLIPFLSTYDLYEISWSGGMGILMIILTLLSVVLSATVILSAIIGVVTFVLSMVFSVKLAKSFGKGAGFGIGLILLAPVFYLILAFGSAKYVGPHNPGYQNMPMPSAAVPQPNNNNQAVLNQILDKTNKVLDQVKDKSGQVINQAENKIRQGMNQNPAGNYQGMNQLPAGNRADMNRAALDNHQAMNQYQYADPQNISGTPEGTEILYKTRKNPPQWSVNPASHSASLVGTSGMHNGLKMKLSQEKACVFGRDPETCTVVFDNRASKVSRKHCQIFYVPSNQRYAIQDLGSSNGTMIVRGNSRLIIPKNKTIFLKNGDGIFFPENVSSFTVRLQA